MVNRLIYTLLFVVLIAAQGRSLGVSVTHACFSADGAPYVELYFHFLGPSFAEVEEGENLKSSEVEITIYFKKEDQIVDFDKYSLKSPSSEQLMDFQDLKRYAIDAGEYDLEINFQDLNDPDNSYQYKEDLGVPVTNELAFSDIQLMASISKDSEEDKNANTNNAFTKNGIAFEALPYDFLDNKYDELFFYQEIYNTNSIEKECYISYAIVDENQKEISKGYKKLSKAAVNPLMITLDIEEVPSGSYSLSVELRDRDKKLLKTNKKEFRRSNPDVDILLNAQNNTSSEREKFVEKLDKEKLDYYLRALGPVLPNDQISILNAVVSSDNFETKSYYLYAHYSQYGTSNAYPVFLKYMEVADAVHHMYYSGFGYGFESDRGYIYLKYGRPTSKVSIENEPSAPPYEMWVYDIIEVNRQKNVKFVFYNPNLVHNDFQLLHSTCRGEKFNLAWEVELYRQDTNVIGRVNSDTEELPDKMGRQARSIFEDL